MRIMPKRNASLAAIGLIALIVAAVFVVMWIAGIGVFASSTTQTATTATTVTVRLRAFNPANEVESRAFFVSLWTSTRATQAEIERQQRVVKSDPTVSNQTNLVGLQQQCTLLATHYNAAALAVAPQAFRAAGLPPQISTDECTR
jgi:sensor c-di-GMP phosphodiesterase-like protein